MTIQILRQPPKPVCSLNSCHICSLLTLTAITGCCSSNASDDGNAYRGWLPALLLPRRLQLRRPKPAEVPDTTSCDLSALNFPPLCHMERATVADLAKELCSWGLNALLSGNSNLVRYLKSGWVEPGYGKHSTSPVFCEGILSSFLLLGFLRFLCYWILLLLTKSLNVVNFVKKLVLRTHSEQESCAWAVCEPRVFYRWQQSCLRWRMGSSLWLTCSFSRRAGFSPVPLVAGGIPVLPAALAGPGSASLCGAPRAARLGDGDHAGAGGPQQGRVALAGGTWSHAGSGRGGWWWVCRGCTQPWAAVSPAAVAGHQHASQAAQCQPTRGRGQQPRQSQRSPLGWVTHHTK